MINVGCYIHTYFMCAKINTKHKIKYVLNVLKQNTHITGNVTIHYGTSIRVEYINI